ncbi:L-Aspartase-like protein [Immersiella caudata]|uniref:L-Aspartase-like protein n=1 Tax=Immersiella caudata TaxID=314043 RepID=A0AA39T1W4_9PEZI|nr:L-Aspartase-like protein [Immersiella caudata]
MADKKPSGNMLWGGRFTSGLDPLMAELKKIEQGLPEVQKEWDAGTFKIVPGVDEDTHTANERRLGEITGQDVAGKLHTGWSRNEQIATDTRMWLRDKLRTIEEHLQAFLNVIAARAEKEIDHIMPGYTHLQRVQRIRWSHRMLLYGFAFASDLERLREVIKRVNCSALGCGALARNPFNIDRDQMFKELGFDDPLRNLMGGVADRDFGLPSTYNKDLQESVEPMIDHVKTVSDSIQIANGVLATLTVRPDRMQASLDPFMLATELAGYLVRKGVPFRETYHISGRCMALSKQTATSMNGLTYEQLNVEMGSARGGTSNSSVL